ncbi:hypothetical protein B0T22DRAFT_498663 [Podospora appendiculata]|uniref:Cyclin N-terminal domain-containing protein n=1 Tax=Podospora appendiculata TaxID=314037 RepID=A0AAE0XA68_9PEZI|nr:hypothetical protein B0T22DRAFT_498663 [Podospora appendiculata]
MAKDHCPYYADHEVDIDLDIDIDFNNSEDDDLDFDHEYFARTYRPLSNLPTPPPSSHNSSAAQSPKTALEDGGLLESELLGPAVHLVNLVPPSASLALPSVPLVHEMLTRADLPHDTIALAVCILDSLNSRFSLNWRLVCPLSQWETSTEHSKRHTLPAGPVAGSRLHIDCVNPEVIVLASLIIAVKFLEDCSSPTQYYRSAWGKDMWTSAQINVTERCIMESLGYRILPLWDPQLIGDALSDMERAGRQGIKEEVCCRQRSMSSGKAVFGLGLQLTPVDTPESENGPSCAGRPVNSTMTAFGRRHSPITRDSLHLPPRTKLDKSFESFDAVVGGV